MTTRFQSAASQYLGQIERQHSVVEILNALDGAVSPLHLRVWGAWLNPPDPNVTSHYVLEENVFHHASVSRALFRELMANVKEYGPSIMTRTAWLKHGAFTFQECHRATNPSAHDKWIFELHVRHGIHDGVYVPIPFMATNGWAPSLWILKFWSDRRVVLSPVDRFELEHVCRHVAHHMRRFVSRKRRKSMKPLSPREFETMHMIYRGVEVEEIVKVLGVKESSVNTYITRAMDKLGAKNRVEAIAKMMARNMLPILDI